MGEGPGAIMMAVLQIALALAVLVSDGPLAHRPARLYGVLQARTAYLAEDYAAGVRAVTLEVGWDAYEPADGQWNAGYIAEQRDRLRSMRRAGMRVVLDPGMQYAPAWARQIRPWRDQYGNTDSGSVNTWSPVVRDRMGRYIRRVLADLGADFAGIRVGSGAFIETLYPDNAPGFAWSYWAFDPDAMAVNPVPAWRPGQPSPNGEAATFYRWYVGHLVEIVNLQHATLRGAGYRGPILQLFPGFGPRGRGADWLIGDNLIPVGRVGVDAAARGAAYDQVIPSIADRSVIVVCSSVGDSSATAPWADDAGSDPIYWSSAHWVADLALRSGRPRWAENVGGNDRETMALVFRLMDRYDYGGLFWFRDADLRDGRYATLADYREMMRGAR